MISSSDAGDRVELVDVIEETEMSDARMLRDVEQRVADQDERQPPGRFLQVRVEELEQLLAALVLVDAADVDGERTADVELLPETRRLRIGRHFRADADDHATARPDCRRCA